jgi:hypothetical protein
MAVDSRHPEYVAAAPQWSRAPDVLSGEDAVKAAGTKYLPRMDSQSEEEYAACKARASFFSATARAFEEYLDLIFRTLTLFLRNDLISPPPPPLTRPRIFLVARSLRKHYCAWPTWIPTRIICRYTKRPTAAAVAAPTAARLLRGLCAGDQPKGSLPTRPAGIAPLCTTLHHFAVILRPSHNSSPPKTSASCSQQLGLIPGPKLCRNRF